MNYNEQMEQKKLERIDFGKVYWCPSLNKHLELCGVDLTDGASFFAREFDVEDWDYEGEVYHAVEKTQLFLVEDSRN